MKKEASMDKHSRRFVEAVCTLLSRAGFISISNDLTEIYEEDDPQMESLANTLENYMDTTFKDQNQLTYRPMYLNACGMMIPLAVINVWEKEDKYSYNKNEIEYRLVINRTSNLKVAYANTVLIFPNKEERDQMYDRIGDLKTFGLDRIFITK